MMMKSINEGKRIELLFANGPHVRNVQNPIVSTEKSHQTGVVEESRRHLHPLTICSKKRLAAEGGV
jgi:hypothetical protein